MSNYSIVVDSRFKPFSYQEMLAPVLMATQAHQELEEQYGELATKASVWEEMANEQTDPYAYKMYKSYANDLEAQANQLAREGLNAASKRDMLNMRSRYSKEITPIEQAYATRQKQAEEQQKALLQDPTLMLSRRAAATSLDDYIRNPQLAYESYSGKLLTAQVSQAASALSKEMREQPRKWRSILGNSYYETMMRKGFSSDAVLQAIQGNQQASQELTRIVDDAVASSGISGWGDAATIARATDYARQGLWSAVGETQYQVLDNWRAKMAEQEAQQIRADKRKADQAALARLNKLAINPLNIYNNRELSKQENDYKSNTKAYSQYFTKDNNGKWGLTPKGLEEYKKKVKSVEGDVKTSPTEGTYLSGARTVLLDSSFKQFMDSIGMKDINSAGEAWGKYVENNPASMTSKYDATKVTEFDYSIAGTQQGDMKDAIITASRGLDLEEVDYDNKTKQFKSTGEKLTTKDLQNSKYKVTATRFSPYGNTVIIHDDKGNAKRYRMPAGINLTNEQNRDKAMAAAQQWQQVVNTGQYTDDKGNVHQATPYEISHAQLQYEQALQQAYLFHSQLGVQNRVKEQEFNPYGY